MCISMSWPIVLIVAVIQSFMHLLEVVEHKFIFKIPPHEKVTHSKFQGSGRSSIKSKIFKHFSHQFITEAQIHSDFTI